MKLLWPFTWLSVTLVVNAWPAPVSHSEDSHLERGSGNDQDSAVNKALDLNRPSSPSLRDLPSSSRSPTKFGDIASPFSGEASSSTATTAAQGNADFQHIFAPLPTVRTDVVNQFLKSRFRTKSNLPLQLLLSPAEQKAIANMADMHLSHPDITWLHTVVDEPQFDLTYRKQLYIASPIVRHDWRGVMGVPKTEVTAHWLPVMFYKADLDRNGDNHFKVAGVEVVRDPYEAARIIRGWKSMKENLGEIGKKLKMVVRHGVPPL